MTTPAGATLTVPDVLKWDPDQLTTAGTAVDTLSENLDKAVLAAVNSTHNLGESGQWGGGAAQAADARMQLEKLRASAVSQAVLGLQKALTQQVGNLKHTQGEVKRLKDIAETPPAPGIPAFEVRDDGTVSTTKRIQWLYDNRKGPHGEDLLTEAQLQVESIKENIDAARQQLGIQNALAQAQGVATAAVDTLNLEKAKVDLAFAGLGDPETGAGAGPPAPAPTAPAAATPPPAVPPAAPQATPVSSSGQQDSSHVMGNSAGGNDYGGASTYSGPASGGPPAVQPSGDVKEWVEEAKQILIDMGYPPESIDENALAIIIQHESSGDPNAINLTDSNAAAGHPSKGIMQTIDSTFNAYAAPGHHDIWNPVDNIVAGARYSLERYGTVAHPGVVSFEQGGSYHGY